MAVQAGLLGVVLAYLFEVGAKPCLDDVVAAACAVPRPSWWGVVVSAAGGSLLAVGAFWLADRRRRAVSDFLRRRQFMAAFIAAGLAAFLVSSVVDDALRDAKVGCQLQVGGEAGAGTYLCPDGIYYAGPALAAFAISFLLILGVGLVWARRKARDSGESAGGHRFHRWPALLAERGGERGARKSGAHRGPSPSRHM